tara:strand:- start:24 stop:1304 length:1281 start_codon:yes stop_codon:yes gene_type:complete
MTTKEVLFKRASKVIPGGVNSPVRSFKSVGSTPFFTTKGEGAYIYDQDNNKYIDYVGSWGPLILGHAYPEVITAVQEQATLGLTYGTATELEILLAEKVLDIMPNIEKIRFVSSGTEATMSAIRLARGYTKRDKIIKFTGCYHGHADHLLVAAGSGALTLGVPSSAGVPESFTEHTLLAEYNNIENVKELFDNYKDKIAAIIIEPVPGNMNLIVPHDDFLSKLRELCDANNTLLIFDEVMSGFRVSLGGAQKLYNVKPDLTTLGKVIGGGMPVGAIGGRADIMDNFAPLGKVYQAGTLSGNPIAMRAGLVTLDILSQKDFFKKIQNQTEKLVSGINEIAQKYNIKMYAKSLGTMFGLYFTENKNIKFYSDIINSDIDSFNKFFKAMLNNGVYFAPSAYEAGFVSIMHDDIVIKNTLEAIDEVFSAY